MQRLAVSCLVVTMLAACADPGPRDRSLMARALPGGAGDAAYLKPPPDKSGAPSSVVGLAPDPLANYYAEDAELILRFEPVTVLERQWAAEWSRLRKHLPGLPAKLDVMRAVRTVLELPPGVTMDGVRPFALVKLPEGWVGVLPSRSRDAAGPRLKPIDAIYSVAGDPALIGGYEPRFRKGFHLPGQVGLLGRPEALATLGTELTLLTAHLGLDLSSLDDVLTPVPADVDRIDLSLQTTEKAVRLDLRVAPRRGTPTANLLSTLSPTTGASQRWLPDGAAAYVELVESPLDLEGLVLSLWHGRFRRATPKTRRDLDRLRPFLAALGSDAGLALELDATGKGTAALVATLPDPDATRAYLASTKFTALLNHIAGAEGDLEWKTAAFERAGSPVGTIAGSISRARILSWRESGRPLLSTLSVFLAGPVLLHVAVVEDRLVVVAGAGGQADAIRYLDHLESGSARDNDHNREIAPLFRERIAAASIDLAALFDGCREAAPFWHENGRALRKAALRRRLPVSFAITVEAEALRAALRVRPHRLAEAWLLVRKALAR